jgi:hypothetical protein
LDRWPLLFAIALAAMTAGHTLELGLERVGLFGDGTAAYGHVALGSALTLAVSLILLGIGVLVFRVARSSRARVASADWVVPAFDAVRRMGFAAAAMRIALMQFPALLTVELIEQRLSGIVHPSLGLIFGPGHITAPFVQVLTCAVAAWSLVKIAAAVCAHVRDVVRAARSVLDTFDAAPRGTAVRSTLRALVAIAFSRPKKRSVLALRIANRPPPAISAARA